MFANCWQVLVSLLYVQYNALLTAFLVGEEWSRFACAPFNDRVAIVQANKIERYNNMKAGLSASRYSRAVTSVQGFLHPLSTRLCQWYLMARSKLRRLCSPAMKPVRALSSKATTKSQPAILTICKWFSSEPELRVRKTLRVSAPEGIQRSSYFVSMPWKYGIPLISAMSVLHWLISQSIFVYAAEVYKADGTLDDNIPFVTGAGFSIEPIICGECTQYTRPDNKG